MEDLGFTPDILTETAKNSFGLDYLYPYQRLVISNILEAGDANSADVPLPGDETDPPAKQIVILPTGAGKSLCFMLPSILLAGPTLVIFPLLSLISDQLRRCEEAGIGAACLTGGQSRADREAAFSGIANGSVGIVLTNPETALSPRVLPKLKECRFMHLVFDEVHTVSEWGDTFRSVYLESRRIYEEAEIPIVTAFTATASETVLKRVKEILFPDEHPHIVSANPDRPNISYTVLPSLCKINSLQLLLQQGKAEDVGQSSTGQNPYRDYLPAGLVQRPVLIFCSTRRTAERTALELRLRMHEDEIFFYHAGLSREEKSKIEKWYHKSSDGILAATIAFGMGVDKSNIRTVIHHDLSPSVEAYLQESGRAGRDREPAEAILLLSPTDRRTDSRRNTSAEAATRYEGLLRFATDYRTCRRESLMLLLGAEPDTCFGCDFCRKSVEHTPPWQHEIISLIQRNRRLLTPAAAVKMLVKNYPSLDEHDAHIMISELLTAGRLIRIEHGPWKNMLKPGNTKIFSRQVHMDFF